MIFDLDGLGRLLNGLALAGERRLGHKQVLGGDDAHIGRDHVAGGELHDIAGTTFSMGISRPAFPPRITQQVVVTMFLRALAALSLLDSCV